MDCLTKHSKQTPHENGICCTHFLGPECLGVGGNCAMNCKWEEAAWSRLAAYEDTGLTPERCAEFARADAEGRYIVMRDAEQEGVALLRELAEADKDGRVVVLPCKVGDTVWAILDGAKYARECKVDFVNIGSFGTTIVFAVKDGLREQYGVTAAAFGKTVFLTRKEAEKALEAMKDA
jgi:hypothetical protein